MPNPDYAFHEHRDRLIDYQQLAHLEVSKVQGAGIREVASTLGSANRFVNGLIDDVRIYNTVLTAGEIQNLYANIPEPTTVALVVGGFLALAAWRELRRK